MFGGWITLFLYTSLLLCDMFSFKSWVEYINVLIYSFGPLKLTIFFLPVLFLIYSHYQWINLFLYSNFPKGKKEQNEMLKDEKITISDLSLERQQIYISQNYVIIGNKILRKNNDYQVELNKKGNVIIKNSDSLKIILKTTLKEKELINYAKRIKEILIKKDNELVLDKLSDNKKRKNYLLIASATNAMLFLLFMNFVNMPLNEMFYLIVKLSTIILGICFCLFSNIVSKKILRYKEKHLIIIGMLGFLPMFCIIGQELAMQTLLGIMGI